MKIAFASLLVTLCLLNCSVAGAQTFKKITGPLGVYDFLPGNTYADTSGVDSATIQSQWHFGELYITNQDLYFGQTFQSRLDSALQYKPNKILGIIQPPTEHGTYNQPADTMLYAPFLQANYPGMVQGGQRFSKLSQLYGGISGVILDDWNGDTAITRQVRDAVQGKDVDETGYVNSNSIAATPYNKLFAVLYKIDAVPAALPVTDGLVYSLFHSQLCCYATIDSQINVLRTNFPHKEIVIATFINNSYQGWTDSVSFAYMLQHTLNRYDDGDINGVNIFAEVYLQRAYMPLTVWDSLALPQLLNSIYFPYLGAGTGQVYNCEGIPLAGAGVHVFCSGRHSGDTLLRSNQRTDNTGNFQVGLWAGNRNTDSTYYWAITEKNGYITDTTGFWVKRQSTTVIPAITLCPDADNPQGQLVTYPNPVQNLCNITLTNAGLFTGPVILYDGLGRKVAETFAPDGSSSIDMSNFAKGMYFVKAGNNIHKVIKD